MDVSFLIKAAKENDRDFILKNSSFFSSLFIFERKNIARVALRSGSENAFHAIFFGEKKIGGFMQEIHLFESLLEDVIEKDGTKEEILFLKEFLTREKEHCFVKIFFSNAVRYNQHEVVGFLRPIQKDSTIFEVLHREASDDELFCPGHKMFDQLYDMFSAETLRELLNTTKSAGQSVYDYLDPELSKKALLVIENRLRVDEEKAHLLSATKKQITSNSFPKPKKI